MITTVVDGQTRLLGARCGCGTHTFPPQQRCPKCGGDMVDTPLPAEGTLWTWTVQRIPPKPPYRSPDPFEPFAVGYVDLGVLKVESPLRGKAADEWTIGDAVRLVVGDAAHGSAPVTFVFEPAPGMAVVS
jgi:uncharacterized OB-fold protein